MGNMKKQMSDQEDTVLDNITVGKILASLDEEKRDIIVLWMQDSFTLEEIGEIVGNKYRGTPMGAENVRYHKNRIIRQLKVTFKKP